MIFVWQIHKRGADAHWRCTETFKEADGNIGNTEEVMTMNFLITCYHYDSGNNCLMLLPVTLLLPPVSLVIKRGRLRWYGHVEHKDNDDWGTQCMSPWWVCIEWSEEELLEHYWGWGMSAQWLRKVGGSDMLNVKTIMIGPRDERIRRRAT